MNRLSCLSCDAIFLIITLCAALPSGKTEDKSSSIFAKEGIQLYSRFHHLNHRSTAVTINNTQESVNKKRSVAAFIPSTSIQRAIPENIPTAFVHTSLGEFKEIPKSPQLDSSNPQERENLAIFGFYNTKGLPRGEDLFRFVDTREDDGIDSLVSGNQNIGPLTDDHISQAENVMSQIDNFQTYESSPQIQSFLHDNANENANIDQRKYTLDEEQILPLGEEINIQLSNSENPEEVSLISESLQEEYPQEVIYTSLEDLYSNSGLLKNNNLEEAYYVDYPESDILNEQHAGHILHEIKGTNNQNTQDEDPPHKTTGTVNQDELVDGNLEQKDSPNLQMNIIQEGKKAIVQRLEPTLIFSNVSPYKVETQKFIYPLVPSNQFATNLQSQVKGAASENSVQLSEKKETKHTVTSVDSETFPSNGAIHTVYNIQKREQAHESHSFVPSYLGQALKSQGSQLLSRGRSLGGFDAQHDEQDTGFSPGYVTLCVLGFCQTATVKMKERERLQSAEVVE